MDEWFESFEKLYLDKNLRKTMADNNIQKIENEYNHEKNCKEYVKLLKHLAKG